MKINRTFLTVILCTFLIYFATATNFTYRPKWSLDYFNLLAQSLQNGRFDIPNPPTTYDLVNFDGKWFAPWGILPALILMPIQLIKGRFVPPLYLSLFFASVNVGLVYLLLRRVSREFFPTFRSWEILAVTALFAFGTASFYVGTLGSVWHVDQSVTSALGTLGLLMVFKKKRSVVDYRRSAWLLSFSLLGRPTTVLLMVVPVFLYFWQYKRTALSIFGVPLVIFSLLFFAYNFVRFRNPLEYGYGYIRESPYLAEIRQKSGAFSLTNLRHNIWYMVAEVPSLSRNGAPKLSFNLKGNSIFFLSPPLLAAFLASPWIRRKKNLKLDPYVSALWLAAIITMIPSLMHYSTGWMQFGYRYTLDIMPILVLLSVFGVRGKLNVLYVAGSIFAVWMYWIGIHALM